MIRRVVDFALGNRLLVLGLALVLFVWGIISFHNLPIEAYPDVADNYVEIITQWPGISAEQIEQQVTIPLEIVMNGIPGVVHLRSFSLFGLSDLKLDLRRRHRQRLEPRTRPRASEPGHASAQRQPADGHRLESRRPDLFLHPAQHQSRSTTRWS